MNELGHTITLADGTKVRGYQPRPTTKEPIDGTINKLEKEIFWLNIKILFCVILASVAFTVALKGVL